MVDQDGRHSKMITQLFLYLTSSSHDADVKLKTKFSDTPSTLKVIAFIFLESRRGVGWNPSPPLSSRCRRPKKARSE